ncbi:MAG TPA: S8 family serine peptidase [Candidatus Eisenbacteria bacterium]|nr:S8 family serine peptidase [Candidatus Eisenbacteria bacterium]
MNRKFLVALSVLALSASLAEARPQPRLPSPVRGLRYRPGELLVMPADFSRFQRRSDGSFSTSDARLQAALARHGLTRFRLSGSRAMTLRSDLPGFDPVAAAADLRRTGAFRAVAPNLRLDLYETVPNDPYLIFQWQIRSTPENTDVQVTDAWDVWKGDTSTVIAIMDNGLDVSHPDLASQVWINRAEIPGNGLDDDGNGYIDDVKGWDFGNDDNDPSSEPVIDASGLDVGFHGTFVAGVAAASTHNGLGIAGAAWKCRFMALKVGDSNGAIMLESVVEAFDYMVGKGAAVLNMSFGTSDTTAREFLQAAVDDADAANILCVAGAGNDGASVKTWPAACDGVISVGATAENNTRASFSNHGPWVDVAAPGSLIWSSICQNYVLDDLSYILYVFLFGYDGANPYMYADGTSFASPLVAGVCGLIRSKMPALTPAQVAAHVVATGDVIPYDQPIGPRVNAHRALTQLAVGVEPQPAAGLQLEDAWPNPFTSATTMAFTLSRAAPVRLAIHDPTGRRVRLLVNATLPSGRHAIRWDGLDGGGRSLPSGVYFVTLESADFRGARKLVLAR